MHLPYVRQGTGHALTGARQQVPASRWLTRRQSLVTGLPPDLRFRTRGQLTAGLCADAYAGGAVFDFIAGDEVYGASPDLRTYLESRGQAYVLRVASSFTITLTSETTVTCAQAVKTLLKDRRSWEVRSAGQGSKGQRWYAWAWIGTGTSEEHSVLARRHLKTGDLEIAGYPGMVYRLLWGNAALLSIVCW